MIHRVKAVGKCVYLTYYSRPAFFKISLKRNLARRLVACMVTESRVRGRSLDTCCILRGQTIPAKVDVQISAVAHLT